MKKLTLLFVVTSLFMIFPTIAAADHYSDGKLLQKTCNKALKLFDSRATADPLQAGSCLGYIRAANDMYEIMVNNTFPASNLNLKSETSMKKPALY